MSKKALILFVISLLILIQISPIASAQQPRARKPERGGCVPCLVGCFFGPRAGFMYNEGVGIRMWEILEFLISPLVLVSLFQIYQGKTWTEIEAEEGLRDPAFKTWHLWMLEKKVYK